MTSQSSKKLLKYVLIVLIIAVIAFLCYTLFMYNKIARESEQHNFHYTIGISYTSTIENVTIFLPVPMLNGTTVLAEPFLDGTVYGVPGNWNLSIEMVNATPMLAIRANEMVPEYHGYPIAIEPGQSPLPTTLVPGKEYSVDTPILWPVSLGTMYAADRTIDTRNPVGREPLFAPGGEFTSKAASTQPYSHGREYGYSVPVYVMYSADAPSDISIITSIQGTNAIWRGGWTSNTYTDTVTVEVSESPGWVNANGILRTEEGVYF